jgi:rubrerythrin
MAATLAVQAKFSQVCRLFSLIKLDHSQTAINVADSVSKAQIRSEALNKAVEKNNPRKKAVTMRVLSMN